MATLVGLKDDGPANLTPTGGTKTAVYLVRMDDWEEPITEAAFATGIPDAFATLAELPGATLNSKNCKRYGNTLYVEVTCEWATPQVNDGTDTQVQPDPLDNTPTLSVEIEEREELLRGKKGSSREYDGAILNSAGEVYDPPVTRKYGGINITITKNYAYTYDAFNTAFQYLYTVNTDSFFGAGAREWLITGVKPKTNRQGSTTFLEVSFNMSHNPETWDIELLDQGTWYWEDGEKREFKVDGHPVIGLLNGSGGKLSDEDVLAGNAVFLEPIQQYTGNAFAGLGLSSDVGDYKLV